MPGEELMFQLSKFVIFLFHISMAKNSLNLSMLGKYNPYEQNGCEKVYISQLNGYPVFPCPCICHTGLKMKVVIYANFVEFCAII